MDELKPLTIAVTETWSTYDLKVTPNLSRDNYINVIESDGGVFFIIVANYTNIRHFVNLMVMELVKSLRVNLRIDGLLLRY